MRKIFKIFGLLGFVILLQAKSEEYQLQTSKEEIIKFIKQDSAKFLKYKKQHKRYYEEFNKINQTLILAFQNTQKEDLSYTIRDFQKALQKEKEFYALKVIEAKDLNLDEMIKFLKKAKTSLDNYEFIEPRLIEHCDSMEDLGIYCEPSTLLKMREFFIFNLALDKTKDFLDKKILKEKDAEKLSIMLFSRAFTSYLKERFFEFKNIKKDVLKAQRLGISKEKIKNTFELSDKFLEAFLQISSQDNADIEIFLKNNFFNIEMIGQDLGVLSIYNDGIRYLVGYGLDGGTAGFKALFIKDGYGYPREAEESYDIASFIPFDKQIYFLDKVDNMHKELFKIVPIYGKNGIKDYNSFRKDIFLRARLNKESNVMDVINELNIDDYDGRILLYRNNPKSYYEKIAKEYDINTEDLQRVIEDDFINYKILGKFSALNDKTKQLLVCEEHKYYVERPRRSCLLWDISKDKKPVEIYYFSEPYGFFNDMQIKIFTEAEDEENKLCFYVSDDTSSKIFYLFRDKDNEIKEKILREEKHQILFSAWELLKKYDEDY